VRSAEHPDYDILRKYSRDVNAVRQRLCFATTWTCIRCPLKLEAHA
jgi:hypothetical protein